MGLLKRILICIIILILANYGIFNILSAIGIQDRDSMPLLLWFSVIGLFVVILPPVAGLLFGSGGKITMDVMKKSTDRYNKIRNIKKVVGMM